MKKACRSSLSLVVFFMLCISNISYGQGVNLKNGNMFYSQNYYDALVFKNDEEGTRYDIPFSILRTYNSKSVYKGWFGNGWGSQFETYLIATPDQGIVIYNHGAGGKTYLYSNLRNEENTSLMIDLIIKAALKSNRYENEEDYIEFKDDLFKSAATRADSWNRYLKDGLLEPYLPQEGIKFYSTSCGCPGEDNGVTLNFIEYSSGTFNYRKLNEDRIYSFNNKGQLSGLTKASDGSYFLTLIYQNEKHLKIKSFDNKILNVYFNEEKLVDSLITQRNGKIKKSRYYYNDGNLVFADPIWGYSKQHLYDEKHNLIETIHNPIRIKGIKNKKSNTEMEYDEKNFISKIRYKDSTYETFKYVGDDDIYGTIVDVFSKDSVLTKHYEKHYSIATTALGDRWNQKGVFILDQDTTTTFYDEQTRNAVKIQYRDEAYEITYDNKGSLTSFVIDGELVNIELDEFGNPTKLITQNMTYDISYEEGKAKFISYDVHFLDLPLSLEEDYDNNKELNQLHICLSAVGNDFLFQKDESMHH